MLGIRRARQLLADTAESPPDDRPVAEWTIRDLVTRYPEAMTVLGPLGIDLCCGGAHPLGEALTLHGLDREPVLTQVASIIEASRERAVSGGW